MDLASKVAADFVESALWKDLSANIRISQKHQREQIIEMQTKGKAISEIWSAFRWWTMKLESSNPEPKEVAREMRELMKKLEGLLYG